MTDAQTLDALSWAVLSGLSVQPRRFASRPLAARVRHATAELSRIRTLADQGDQAATAFLNLHARQLNGHNAAQVRTSEQPAPPIREIIQAVLARVESPPRFSQARGIVTAAGGKTLLVNAYVLFRLLRHLGCTLPIECWQLPHERDEAWQRLVEPLGVEIVDARARGFVGSPFADGSKIHFLGDTSKHYRRDMLDGYALKAFALQWCDFRQALFLDADNSPARDPTEAFDWPEFRKAGLVLWPDADSEHAGSSGFALPRNSMFGLPELRETMTNDWRNGCETGQILVDKTRLHTWQALSLGTWMGEHPEYFYVCSWGEKEHPAACARLVGFEPAITPHAATLDNYICVQRDFAGKEFLWHRFGPGRKLARDGNYIRPATFPHNDFCDEVLSELRERWG